MPKPSPTLYSVTKTFFWFFIVSVVLLVSLVGIVYTDTHREWKDWQKKFIRLKTQKTEAEFKEAAANVDSQALENLKLELIRAKDGVDAHRADMKTLEKESGRLDTEILKAKGETQNLKQFQDSYKYYLEEHLRHKDPKAEEYRLKLELLSPKLEKAKGTLEALEKQKEEKTAALSGWLAKEKELQAQADKLLSEKTRIERKLEKVKPTLAKDILNAPMIDFLAPTLKVQQIVLDGLTDDYHFVKTQKVDRCTTCHLGIDQKGFEDAPQPFRTHPKLDLFLGPASPHPIEKIGCTVCHSGSGHSVSFKDSAHTPRDEEQKLRWQKQHQWKELEKWEQKMLPMNHIEAACAKCHQGTVQVPEAAKLNQGRRLALAEGCFNCHKVEGFESAWKVGPALDNVSGKLSQDWIERWLEDPQSFRPSTRMPRIFHLSNMSSAEDREKDTAVIHAIAAYLTKNSKNAELIKPPLPGDATRGEKLVKDLGCLGCHSAAGVAAGNAGPELSGLGSKVTPEWLYSWLKDPKHASQNTRMPNLRLSDEEASDITSFLLSQKNEAFDQRPVAVAKPEVTDELILAFLRGAMRESEARTELSKMNADERLEFLGKKSIAHQGCFGCHSIKGFEDAKPIGTELTQEGSKDIHQFDFGFTDIERTRQAFISTKLKDPRIFDAGKIRAYHEKLRMPQFNLSDEEVEALTTFILSLTQEQIPLEMQKRLDLKEQKIEKGRMLVTKLNCAGCHALDGQPGTLRELAEDKGQAPPVLDGEGAKVQEVWLHEFLKKPETIRPWLAARMPTFGLTEEETGDIVHYLAYLAHQDVSYQGYKIPESTPEKLANGRKLFESFQCAKCHEVNPQSVAMGTSFLAPDLKLTKGRLKPEWVKQWLLDPQKLQEGTMMPSFFQEGQSPLTDIYGGDADAQAEAMRDYLYHYGSEPQPVAKDEKK